MYHKIIVALALVIMVWDLHKMIYIYYLHVKCPPVDPRSWCENGHGTGIWDTHNYPMGFIYGNIYLKMMLIAYGTCFWCCPWNSVLTALLFSGALALAGYLDLRVCNEGAKCWHERSFDVGIIYIILGQAIIFAWCLRPRKQQTGQEYEQASESTSNYEEAEPAKWNKAINKPQKTRPKAAASPEKTPRAYENA